MAPVESSAFPGPFAGSYDKKKGVEVIYLGIFLIAAAAGILVLWWSQHRQRKHLQSVDGFRTSLERISAHHVAIPDAARERRTAPRPGGRRRPEPLDPARREAAKRRLAHRRAAGI